MVICILPLIDVINLIIHETLYATFYICDVDNEFLDLFHIYAKEVS